MPKQENEILKTNAESGAESFPKEATPNTIEAGKEIIERREFVKDITNYFEEQKSVSREVRGNTAKSEIQEQLLQNEMFLDEQFGTLLKLASPETAKKMDSKEFSFALSELAGNMALGHQDTGKTELDEQYNKQYLEAKKLFLASAKRIYPEANLLQLAASNLKTEIKKLSNIGGFSDKFGNKDVSVISAVSERIQKEWNTDFLEKNPKKVLAELDSILIQIGDRMKSVSLQEYNNSDDEEKEPVQQKLDIAAEQMYKLQLMRNQLVKVIYGREDITPIEITEIENSKKSIE